MKKLFYFGVLFLTFFISSTSVTHAQENKSYYYKSFDATISVEKDSSFEVEERQVYSYTGSYNKGYRNIPFKGISDITDVQVVDGQTGQPLEYSSKVLEKTSPSSWGKYTYYKKGGDMVIEWYYNIANADHLWILKYKVYGGIGFYKDHDEVYWNIFTDYDVPIASSTVFIKLPSNNFSPADFQAAAYTSTAENNPQKLYRDTDHMFSYFSAGPFAPKQAFTVALGWPKGLLHESDFWKYWILKNGLNMLSILIIPGTFIFLFVYWLFSEKLKKGRGTIVAEYTPPQNLPPAMADIIVTESVSPRSWSATVVDLAVRGYIKIEEDSHTWKDDVGSWVAVFLIFIFFGVSFSQVPVFLLMSNVPGFVVGSFFISMILVSFYKALFTKRTDYILIKLKDFKDDQSLHDYEKTFLKILFDGRENFSTKRMRSGTNDAKDKMYQKMLDLQEKLGKEVSKDEAFAYDISFVNQNKLAIVIFLPFIYLFLALFIFIVLHPFSSYLLVVVAALWSWNTISIFIKYNPRLSEKGRIFKEEWLGFKLYLETAEKYRMQDLTPETFEKYLPYAIIFGVEKKWAKAFDSIVKTEPGWYGHHAGGASYAAGSASGFSASSFSSSFSSSLSSAFASSGAGGGSHGGGSAGGGGGGGGGGAS